MRKPVIAGNWKMNTTPAEGAELARAVVAGCADLAAAVDVLLCPPFTGLTAARDAVAGSAVLVGAQTVHEAESGAFTGEISAAMLTGLATHVLVGHSERRALFAESSRMVAEKAVAATRAGLTPVVCVGESLEVRKSGNAAGAARKQLRDSLAGFDEWSALIVAYEPVWAIGTGEAASPQQAQEMARALRDELAEIAGGEIADTIRILYGGSVTGNNIGPFIDRPDIDGALVGGASLKADEFVRIIELAARISGC